MLIAGANKAETQSGTVIVQNMSMWSPSSTETFRPPQGLQPNEEVLWAQRSSWAFSGKKTTAVLLMFGGLLTSLGLYSLSGPALPQCTRPTPQTTCGNPSLVLGIGVVIVLGGLFSLYRTMAQRETRYYLTSFRLVEAQGGRIAKQVSRARYRGKILSQFLYTVPLNIMGGVQTYGVRILDPDSGDALMTLSNISQDSVNLFESIISVIYCKYCGRKNNATAAVCQNCGANL